jgi:hypothetical protein
VQKYIKTDFFKEMLIYNSLQMECKTQNTGISSMHVVGSNVEIHRQYLHLSSQSLNISDTITYCGEVYRVSFANCRIYFITAFNSYLVYIPEIDSTSFTDRRGICYSQRLMCERKYFCGTFNP